MDPGTMRTVTPAPPLPCLVMDKRQPDHAKGTQATCGPHPGQVTKGLSSLGQTGQEVRAAEEEKTSPSLEITAILARTSA